MKICIILIACFFTTIKFDCNAQQLQGKAIYKTHRKIDIEFGKSKNAPNDEVQKQLQEQLKKMYQKTFTLLFTNYESSYKENVKLSAPSPKTTGIQIITSRENSTALLYKNLKNNTYLNTTDIMGKLFLIKDTIQNQKWKLTTETKNIGNYTCYKAFIKKEIEKKNFKKIDGKVEETIKKITKTTIAWYTPQIPVSNGPKNFGGLPGLILEVNDGKLTIVCTEIIINPKEKIMIKAPTKGKEVSQNKYDIIREEKSKEIIERSRSKNNGKFNINFGG